MHENGNGCSFLFLFDLFESSKTPKINPKQNRQSQLGLSFTSFSIFFLLSFFSFDCWEEACVLNDKVRP